MTRKIFLAILLSLLLPAAWAQQAPQKDADYDAVRDFSIQSNPNGAWSYGYLETWGAPFTLYSTGEICIPNVSSWRIPDCYTDSPGIYHNETTEPVCWMTWCLPPDYLLMDPRSQPTNLRWTAPFSGNYVMQATFVGLDWEAPTSTSVYVLIDSKTTVLSGPIHSYAWPLTFTQRGSVRAGDTVDFIVDWGKDADFNYDATGLKVKIWSLQQQ